MRVLESSLQQNEGNLKTRVVESLLPSWLDLWFLPFWSRMMLAQGGQDLCCVFFSLTGQLTWTHGHDSRASRDS